MLVGDTGIEPVTSSVSGKRSPAELIALTVLAERVVPRGGNGIRTRVHGFAGRCLASRPSHQEGPQVRKPEPLPSGRRDSNPRPSPWQGDALPTALRPPIVAARWGRDGWATVSESGRALQTGAPLALRHADGERPGVDPAGAGLPLDQGRTDGSFSVFRDTPGSQPAIVIPNVIPNCHPTPCC